MKFSNKSLILLSQADSRLQSIMNLAIQVTDVDFGISETLRTTERQKELFRTGKSKTLNSKHLTGRAVDIFVASKEYDYDEKHLIYLAGVILTCGNIIGHPVRWGGNWDMDQIIIHDQKFQDFCHFELID